MALQFNCLEPLMSLGCGLAALSAHGPALSDMADAAIAGVSLLTKIRENVRRHGLDEPALMERMRLATLRAMGDRLDATDETRDAIVLADQAMARLLPEVMLTRAQLGESAVASATELYPLHAARLVADRLAERHIMFAQVAGDEDDQPIARQFAIRVVRAALDCARNDPAYAALLTQDILVSVARATATLVEQGQLTHGQNVETHRQNRHTHQLLDELSAQQNSRLAGIEAALAELAGGRISADLLREELGALMQFDPSLSTQAMVQKVRDRIIQRDNELMALRVLSETDGVIEAERRTAEAALEANDDLAAALALARASERLNQRRRGDAETIITLAMMRAEISLRQFNWLAANEAWVEAAYAAGSFDPRRQATILGGAASELMMFGRAQSNVIAIDQAITHLRRCAELFEASGSEYEQHCAVADLGLALDLRARQSDEDLASIYLGEALAAQYGVIELIDDRYLKAAILSNVSASLRFSTTLVPASDLPDTVAASIAAARSARDLIDEAQDAERWARLNINFATALHTAAWVRPRDMRLSAFAHASDVYRRSIAILMEKEAWLALAFAFEDLARCYRDMADHASAENVSERLRSALGMAELAARIFTPEQTPANYRSVQRLCAELKQRLGSTGDPPAS